MASPLASSSMPPVAAHPCDGQCSERVRAEGLQSQLERTRRENASNLARLEEEEEGIVNKLLIRVDELKKKQDQLQMEVDREEEFLTNNLQRKLMAVLREKDSADAALQSAKAELQSTQVQLQKTASDREHMQKQLEEEEAYLQTAIAATNEAAVRDKVSLELELEAEQELITNRLMRQLQSALGAKLEAESRAQALADALEKGVEDALQCMSSFDSGAATTAVSAVIEAAKEELNKLRELVKATASSQQQAQAQAQHQVPVVTSPGPISAAGRGRATPGTPPVHCLRSPGSPSLPGLSIGSSLHRDHHHHHHHPLLTHHHGAAAALAMASSPPSEPVTARSLTGGTYPSPAFGPTASSSSPSISGRQQHGRHPSGPTAAAADGVPSGASSLSAASSARSSPSPSPSLALSSAAAPPSGGGIHSHSQSMHGALAGVPATGTVSGTGSATSGSASSSHRHAIEPPHRHTHTHTYTKPNLLGPSGGATGGGISSLGAPAVSPGQGVYLPPTRFSRSESLGSAASVPTSISSRMATSAAATMMSQPGSPHAAATQAGGSSVGVTTPTRSLIVPSQPPLRAASPLGSPTFPLSSATGDATRSPQLRPLATSPSLAIDAAHAQSGGSGSVVGGGGLMGTPVAAPGGSSVHSSSRLHSARHRAGSDAGLSVSSAVTGGGTAQPAIASTSVASLVEPLRDENLRLRNENFLLQRRLTELLRAAASSSGGSGSGTPVATGSLTPLLHSTPRQGDDAAGSRGKAAHAVGSLPLAQMTIGGADDGDTASVRTGSGIGGGDAVPSSAASEVGLSFRRRSRGTSVDSLGAASFTTAATAPPSVVVAANQDGTAAR